MNNFEYERKMKTITPDVIREVGVKSVVMNEKKVVLDSILTNHPNYLTNREIPSAGKTFIGNDIVGVRNYSDWDDSYEFHDNLKFLEDTNIEFISKGKGYDSIKTYFSEDDYIAPTSKSLSEETIKKIKADFINSLKGKINE